MPRTLCKVTKMCTIQTLILVTRSSGSEIMVHGILERVVPRPSQDSTRSEEIYTELRHGFPFPLS